MVAHLAAKLDGTETRGHASEGAAGSGCPRLDPG